jgi:hypothetical protein
VGKGEGRGACCESGASAMGPKSLIRVRVPVPESPRRPSFPGSVAHSSRASRTELVDDPFEGQARTQQRSSKWGRAVDAGCLHMLV